MSAFMLALLSVLVIGSVGSVRAPNPFQLNAIFKEWMKVSGKQYSFFSIRENVDGPFQEYLRSVSSYRVASDSPDVPCEKRKQRNNNHLSDKREDVHVSHLASERERRQGTEVLELREERQNKKVSA